VFVLPVGYAWAYRIYVMAHVILAAWTSYRLARHFGSSVEAAGVASLSYAFSGNVLFQYCNVPFLVGASWLPAAILAADRMLVERRLRWAVWFGIVLALMVLGGDPQTAYHAGLLSVLYALWLWRRERGAAGTPLSLWERVRVRAACVLRFFRRQSSLSRSEGEGAETPGKPGRYAIHRAGAVHRAGTARLSSFSRLPSSFLVRGPLLLGAAALVALILAAVQVLPSAEFSRLSDRSGQWSQALLSRHSEPGTHLDSVYHFSVGPWRLAEYVWPNWSGRQFPIHRRWLEILPAEGRVCVPSPRARCARRSTGTSFSPSPAPRPASMSR